MLDPSRQAHAHADRRLRSEQVAWLTTVRADGQAQSSPMWFLWDGETSLGYETGPFARTYSTSIRVRPTRARVW